MLKNLALLSLVLTFTSVALAQQSESFGPGHYYTKDGVKRSGLLRFNYGGNLFTDKSDGDCSLTFKTDKKAKKEKFTTNDICCFVIKKDSFAIIKNFKLNAFAKYPQDFAKVIEMGKISLYMYYATVNQGQFGVVTVTDWVIEKDGTTTKLTRKQFRELMPDYLQDYPELLAKFQSKELKYDDAPHIIKEYNLYFAKGAAD